VETTTERIQVPIPDFCGRRVSSGDLELVREVVSSCGFSRHELANTVCELLGWKRANRKLKAQECVEWLEELEQQGWIQLPVAKQAGSRASRSRVELTVQSQPQPVIQGSVKDVVPVRLKRVESSQELCRWKELIARHHYLGYRVPFGASLCYLIQITTAEGQRVAGCLQFSSPAWRVKARDQWIGWTDTVRKKRLQRIVSNSRFLIVASVQVKGLASHVLSLVSRKLPEDWYQSYRVRPVLLETFVEQQRYRGTCYRAANWICLGQTRGRGRMDREHRGSEPVKTVWVYPLDRRFRQILKGDRSR
jgi:Druantia protein DruA